MTHKLTPREPTEAMLASIPSYSRNSPAGVAIWRTMWDAAPAPEPSTSPVLHRSQVGCIIVKGVCMRDNCPNHGESMLTAAQAAERIGLYYAPKSVKVPPAMAEIERAVNEFGTACAEISRWSAARVADRKIELLTLIRALAQPRVPEWLPIETAPKDGTVILGWPIYGHAGPREIQWRAWAIVDGQEECWIVCNSAKSKQEVTHWMPLPLPPTETKP